jgi:hypothetical protein
MISAPIPGANRCEKAARLADQLVPPLRGEHPFVQPFAGVAERRVARLTFAGAKAVERDGEVVDAGELHA